MKTIFITETIPEIQGVDSSRVTQTKVMLKQSYLQRMDSHKPTC